MAKRKTVTVLESEMGKVQIPADMITRPAIQALIAPQVAALDAIGAEMICTCGPGEGCTSCAASFSAEPDPGPSEVEVQQMLEARDRSDAPESPLAAPLSHDLPEQTPLPPSNPEGRHALDISPINSKIVVTDEGAVLATPISVGKLPKTDPANRLPTGARITKRAEMVFDSWQLSPAEDHPTQTYATAGEAIRNFVNDFHPHGLHS